MVMARVKRAVNVAGSVKNKLPIPISRQKRPGKLPLLSIVKLEMWYTNWVVILTGESASYLIMRATQKDNLELESMSTEVLLIGRLKNTLVAISQGVMVKILQHI